MDEQPSDPIAACARALWVTAIVLAYTRRANKLRKKGRAFTPRAVKIWCAAKARSEAKCAIAEAFDDLNPNEWSLEKLLRIALACLKSTLMKERSPRSGPKRRHKPLMQIARERTLLHKKRGSTGRRPILDRQEERLWLARFYGLKACLVMDEGGFTRPLDPTDHAKKALAEIKARGGLSFLDGDSGVSDREVLREALVQMTAESAVTLAALRSRLRRARQRQRLSLFE